MKNNVWKFIKQVFSSWSEDNVASMAAALAYYTLFALTPLLIIAISLSGLFLGPEAARGQIVDQISGLVGHETGKQIQQMIESANKPVTALFAQVLGLVMLIFGASGVFGEIQGGLNKIWGVKTNRKENWLALVKHRFLSFSMVLVVAFLLLISLLINVALTAFSDYANLYFSVDKFVLLLSFVFSFLITTLLFALFFKILPDAKIKWTDVWVGAFITSLLFSLGKFILGFYLYHTDVASVFGAAGSLVMLLLWVYYASQIFFIGAEISKIIATRKRKVSPTRDARLRKNR